MAQLKLKFDYNFVLEASKKNSWKLSDVLNDEDSLNFNKLFLPKGLVSTSNLTFLSEEEQLSLNHIMGNSYLCFFEFIEEYIVGLMLRFTDQRKEEEEDALKREVTERFAQEEIKHQELFKKFKHLFIRGFKSPCRFLDTAKTVANNILGESLLAVLLITLHLECETQGHYLEIVKDNDDLDVLFCKLLRYHWLEEVNHTKVDLLEINEVLRDATAEEIETGLNEYYGLLLSVDELCLEQAKYDLDNLSVHLVRKFSSEEEKELLNWIHNSLRKAFIGYGLNYKPLQDVIKEIHENGEKLLGEIKENFSKD